ncbi:MAG: 2-dehydro-3-deoxygalactonokinase DgoK [Saliniramus fredricksonii]|uniref:2-dehydro-3-deoxygalactonokinase DgoK n=1 Tax=Saliniramus fredricksonii TaxID=1653334 RepID=A0A0P8BSP7_9HYPH|nr:2-dehydro-3-deoxygalactonokinase [Saliniramus fredricksonii]KPQ12790.1 MAG: 2-dehydro-3-deoxygalactonokinase DgoK [Saliniramus fredricksonii]SCC82535.1 2-keto-3-deoxygalactonate kinase [Saliniramus fredricksonii]
MPPDLPGAPALIGLDWGTTRLRVMLLDAAGNVIAIRESDEGIRRARGAFAETFAKAIAPWQAQHAGLPVYASGMITSRNGWVQTPYLPLPADAGALAAGLVRHTMPDATVIAFVPGLCDDRGTHPDVMRGEETEIVGHLAQNPQSPDDPARLLILPGTHTKWVETAQGRITRFRTFMTGELYAAMSRHSILGDLMPPHDEAAPCDREAFARGVTAAGTDGGDLLAKLFSARSLVLFERLAPAQIGDYLSGLLIGTEVAQARAAMGERGEIAGAASATACTIIGRGDLAARYAQACEAHGLVAQIAAPGAAGAGLAALHARAAQDSR